MSENKIGRPLGKKFEFFKGIKLNQEQKDNWDVNKVKAFLNNRNTLDILKEMFEKGVIKVYDSKMNEEYKKTLEEL